MKQHIQTPVLRMAAAFVSICPAVCLAIGLFVAPGSVLAEEKPKKSEFTTSAHGDWALRCPKKKASETPQPCTLVQQIVAEKDKSSPIVTVIFVYGGDPAALHGIVRVPLGVALAPGIRMEIDEGEPQQFHFNHCEPGGCLVTARISPELRKKLENGSKAVIGFLSITGQKIVVPASLRGITTGLEALKKK